MRADTASTPIDVLTFEDRIIRRRQQCIVCVNSGGTEGSGDCCADCDCVVYVSVAEYFCFIVQTNNKYVHVVASVAAVYVAKHPLRREGIRIPS